MSYRNKTIEKLNVHIRIGLYGENQKQFEIGELLINNGGYSVETVTGKEQQIIMNGELFKVRSPNYRSLRDTLCFFDIRRRRFRRVYYSSGY
jgi:hypothetical protein